MATGTRLKLTEGSIESPSTNIRGEQWMAKDGEEIDLFGPATGILGPFAWIEEHLADIAHLGQTFPRWSGPHRSVSDIQPYLPLPPTRESFDERER